MAFPLPLIEDTALQKFCEKHNLYEAVAAGYHYAQKFFLAAEMIEIDFYPPYRDDEPEGACITFVVKTGMTSADVLNARDRFNRVMIQIPGAEYICFSHRFTTHESS